MKASTTTSSQDGDGINNDDVLTHVGLYSPEYQAPHLAQREIDEKTRTVVQYLIAEVDEFRKLSDLRRKGWKSADGDRAFEAQRKRADNLGKDVSEYNYKLMSRIADELHTATGAFRMPPRPCSVLDMCAAPGGFLNTTMRLNPGCGAVGFSLAPEEGGYGNLLSPFRRNCMKLLDVTMLAEDMGVAEIPADHPDAAKFLPRHIGETAAFDLALCDGHILRTQDRGGVDAANNENNGKGSSKHYRELYELYRLKYVQLALGLEHLKPGGTMVVLLHKVEMWNTLCTVRRFARFSGQVRLYKPRSGHTTRSSFYLVATAVDSRHPEAVAAVAKWKAV